ncbi:hypothetical protein HMPREF1579_01163 [Gardnerella vaginalis JCP8066]|nr:hypothetical protein HMPREF1579_01163 [Gardnerella vaginalis JCP8066]
MFISVVTIGLLYVFAMTFAKVAFHTQYLVATLRQIYYSAIIYDYIRLSTAIYGYLRLSATIYD